MPRRGGSGGGAPKGGRNDAAAGRLVTNVLYPIVTGALLAYVRPAAVATSPTAAASSPTETAS